VNRRAIAARLSLIVALSGLLPIAAVGSIAIEILSHRMERSSQEALRVVAAQAAARIGRYVEEQYTLVRSLAAAVANTPDVQARLQAVPVDAPSVRRIAVVAPGAKDPEIHLDAARIDSARTSPQQSPWYLAADQTPAMDVCMPMPGQPGTAVCATLDLLELWRLVQRIKVGQSGYALAFDREGRLLAAGEGRLRPAVLRGGTVAQSPAAVAASHSVDSAPVRYQGGAGQEVLAGWAWLPDPGWSVVVEQPVREALAGSRTTQLTLAAVAVAALLLSILVGIATSLPVLTGLEVDERWRTAGRMATGITHDMGHRLAILQQTAAMAEMGNAEFLPRISDNLRNEVATLKKFVGDFADLSREVREADLLPLQLNAFLESMRRTAAPHAEKHGIGISVESAPQNPYVRADRYLLERATLNLVYNGIEASPRGSQVRLRAGLVSDNRGQERAFIEVVDQGAGIAPDRLPRIFDAFKSTKRTGAHVGMGLPNVHRIVNAHGGQVSVQSELGKGSTFTIALPLTGPEELAKPVLEPATPKA
jgi:signal transduction histidine kinase